VIQSPEATAPKTDQGPRGSYREDQGRLARMAAFWGIALFLLFGCTFLHTQLLAVRALATPIGGLRIPVVAVDLSGAFLIAAGLFTAGMIWLTRWQRQPKVADLLIETESELRKVTWPTFEDVMNSSVVVVAFVIALGGFLALADFVLARVMKYIVFGEI